jgi:hypothetical protein
VAETDGLTITPTQSFSGNYLFRVEGTFTLGNSADNAPHSPVLVIDGNQSESVYVRNGGRAVMYNGVEIRNSFTAVVLSGGDDASTAIFTMYGGVIAGNRTGVQFEYATFNMNGGIIYGINEGENSNTTSSVLVRFFNNTIFNLNGVKQTNPDRPDGVANYFTGTYGTAP